MDVSVEGSLIGVLLAAVALDLLFGEPPNRLHPVAYLGALVTMLLRIEPAPVRSRQLMFGAALALSLPTAAAACVAVLLRESAALPLLQLAIMCALFKSSFALKALGDAGLAVRADLELGLEHARHDLRALCSRDPSQLGEPELVAATVESLAENCSDSFVAPVFYYVLFGVPGAVAYRVINTLDAMIGYRGRYEYLGKTAARLDDVFNYVPARLTVLALLAAGALLGHDVRQGARVWRRDRRRTASPNAGRPMATMAGLLRVQLTKQDAYTLGEPLEALVPAKIADAHRILLVTGVLVTGAACLAIGLR